LKVDIEGAERVMFASRSQAWLSRVDNIVIELHDAECRDTFFKAIAVQHFTVTTCDELTVCRRPRSSLSE
jgi:hypothetical protein